MNERRPQSFSPDDPSLQVDEEEYRQASQLSDMKVEEDGLLPDRSRMGKSPVRGVGWAGMFLGAVGGLVALAAGIWVAGFVEGLFLRKDWIGFTALGLIGVATVAALAMLLREVVGLWRIGHITRLRQEAERAIKNDVSLKEARRLVRQIKTLYRGRPDMAWGLSRLRDYEKDVVDPDALTLLAERELLTPLDAQAKQLVAQSTRRVSVVTAISPAAVVDVLYVAVETMKMLHRIASLYGGRPGGSGVFKLARMVITHLTITGGLALTSDFIQQLVGQKLTAKLSARLGEGIFNGALCARIGMAAINICRPLPFIEAKPPKFRDFLTELMRSHPKEKDPVKT